MDPEFVTSIVRDLGGLGIAVLVLLRLDKAVQGLAAEMRELRKAVETALRVADATRTRR